MTWFYHSNGCRFLTLGLLSIFVVIEVAKVKIVVLGDGKTDFNRILTVENSDKKSSELFLALLPYFHNSLLEVNNCCTWKKLLHC